MKSNPDKGHLCCNNQFQDNSNITFVNTDLGIFLIGISNLGVDGTILNFVDSTLSDLDFIKFGNN